MIVLLEKKPILVLIRHLEIGHICIIIHSISLASSPSFPPYASNIKTNKTSQENVLCNSHSQTYIEIFIEMQQFSVS